MGMLPQVSGCCCCFSLRTGALIIGILSLVGTAIAVLTCLVASGTVFVIAESNLTWANNVTSAAGLIGYGDLETVGDLTVDRNLAVDRNLTVDDDLALNDLQNGQQNTNENARTFLLIAGGILLALTVILVIPLSFDIMLVVGIVKNKSCLVRAWVIYRAIGICCSILGLISTLLYQGGTGKYAILSSAFTTSILSLAVSLYYLIVVNSYHRVMVSNPMNSIHKL